MTDDGAFGADDVAGIFYAGKGLRKLRFPMTDNIERHVTVFAHETLATVGGYKILALDTLLTAISR